MADGHADPALGAALAADSLDNYDASAALHAPLPMEAPASAAAAPAAAPAKKKAGFSRKPWTKHEDEMLKELVNRFGPKRWATIASQLPDRIGKQCRERWTNHLRPEISKDPWRPEEDVLIFYYQKLLGNQWAEIAKYLPGRTENAIKNRFHSSLRRFQRQEKRKYGQQAVLRAMFARQGMNIPGFGALAAGMPQAQLALAVEMQKKAGSKKSNKEEGKGEEETADDGSDPNAKGPRAEDGKDETGGVPNPMVGLGTVDPNVSQLLGNFDPAMVAAQQALLMNTPGRQANAAAVASDTISNTKEGQPNPPPANAEVLRAALLQAAAGGNQEVLGKLLGR